MMVDDVVGLRLRMRICANQKKRVVFYYILCVLISVCVLCLAHMKGKETCFVCLLACMKGKGRYMTARKEVANKRTCPRLRFDIPSCSIH
jgi:hypothetical protein